MTEMILEYGRPDVGQYIIMSSQLIASTNVARTVTPIYFDGQVLLVDPTQLWYWSDEWQAGERRVDEYIRDGDYESFDTMEEFIRTLGE